MDAFSESINEKPPKVIAETEEYIDFEWTPSSSIKELPESQLSQYCFDPTFEPIPYRSASTVLKVGFCWVSSLISHIYSLF